MPASQCLALRPPARPSLSPSGRRDTPATPAAIGHLLVAHDKRDPNPPSSPHRSPSAPAPQRRTARDKESPEKDQQLSGHLPRTLSATWRRPWRRPCCPPSPCSEPRPPGGAALNTSLHGLRRKVFAERLRVPVLRPHCPITAKLDFCPPPPLTLKMQSEFLDQQRPLLVILTVIKLIGRRFLKNLRKPLSFVHF